LPNAAHLAQEDVDGDVADSLAQLLDASLQIRFVGGITVQRSQIARIVAQECRCDLA
jgi:hypothetical protein